MQGELWAMMLDAKRTFDELIDRLAPDAKSRDEVLANRIYQELSGAVAGSQEFTAIAKLYELDRSGDFDVLVLDTPPSRNALDFLDAPDRLTGFFEGRALKVFLAPTGIAAKVMGRGTSLVFSVLRRVTGVDLLQDLSVFFGALGGLVDGFRERARASRSSSPTRRRRSSSSRAPSASRSRRRSSSAASSPTPGCRSAGSSSTACSSTCSTATPTRRPPRSTATSTTSCREKVAETLRELRVLADRDRASLTHLMTELDDRDPIVVPLLDGDVHDVDRPSRRCTTPPVRAGRLARRQAGISSSISASAAEAEFAVEVARTAHSPSSARRCSVSSSTSTAMPARRSEAGDDRPSRSRAPRRRGRRARRASRSARTARRAGRAGSRSRGPRLEQRAQGEAAGSVSASAASSRSQARSKRRSAQASSPPRGIRRAASATNARSSSSWSSWRSIGSPGRAGDPPARSTSCHGPSSRRAHPAGARPIAPAS
jgi:hypothetical protein